MLEPGGRGFFTIEGGTVIPTAIAAFVGAFAAQVALAELAARNRVVRYLGAFLVGALLTVGLAWLLEWLSRVFASIA